jgi:hydroxymethylpyrimidine/phosphomethylpyrimidine kinase
MSVSQQLWSANRDLAEACLADPFVAGLASGATSRAHFAWYVGQDAFFLDVFARGYALALAKCSDQRHFTVCKELLDGVVAELQLHGAYAARWGLDLSRVTPGPACLAYTDFLRGVAALESLPQILAAMAPCMRLYAWLGATLLPRLDLASPYAEWVQTYASPGFQDLAQRLDALLDAMGADLTSVAPNYRRAMRLERDFFAACGEPPSEGAKERRSEGGSLRGEDARGASFPRSLALSLPRTGPPSALSIAGSDPSGGAGIQADLKTFHRHGVYGQSVVSLITAQNTTGVTAVHLLPVELVLAQLDAVLNDIAPAAIKTGALGAPELITAVAGRLASVQVPVVVDPVLISKHGHPLASPEAVPALQPLLRLATVITPNWHELAALSGITVTDGASAAVAARTLLARGVRAVLVKGAGDTADDLLVTVTGETVLPGLRIQTRSLHGTGCTYAAALTAQLALGLHLEEAAVRAKAFIAHAIVTAPGLGHGFGPVNHWA